MLHLIIEHACNHYHITSAEAKSKAIRASWSRTVQELSINIIMRTMTGALEADTVITESIGTAQVDATLIERHPVRAITIFDDVLRIQLVGEITAMQ